MHLAIALAVITLAADEVRPAITALAMTPDGKGCVVGSQAGIRYRTLDRATMEPLATKLDHVHALAFSPDGKVLAASGGTPGESGVVELWSWPGRKPLGRLEGHDDLVYDVIWLKKGAALATAGADRTIRLWEFPSRKLTATLTGHSGPVLALAVCPDGSLLCSGSADHTIRVWESATGKLLRSLNNHLGSVHSLSFRASRADEPLTLASAGADNTVRIWQPAVGRMVRILRHPAPVFTVAWTTNGTLVSGAKDGKLRVYDGEETTLLREQHCSWSWITSLAIPSDSDRVAAGDSLGQVHVCKIKP